MERDVAAPSLILRQAAWGLMVVAIAAGLYLVTFGDLEPILPVALLASWWGTFLFEGGRRMAREQTLSWQRREWERTPSP